MFRRQVKADRAAQFRAALARHRERANSTADAEHELELAPKVKDIFHFARNDVIPVSAVISFNSRVFGAYRHQNSLADLGAVDGLWYPYMDIFQSVELDDVEALLLFDDFATEPQDASQRMLDEYTSARASDTRCCCPPLNRIAGRSEKFARPTSSSVSSTRRLISWRLARRTLSGNATFSKTVMCGQIA